MKSLFTKAAVSTAVALIGGLIAAGCAKSGGKSINSSVTTGGQTLSASFNNLGAQPIGMGPNQAVTYTLKVMITDGTGAVSTLSNTAYNLSVSSNNPSVADVSKDTQNSVIVTSKSINGDATITANVGFQGASVSPSFTVRVSGGSGNNGGNNGSSNPNYTIIVRFNTVMPIGPNTIDPYTVWLQDTSVSPAPSPVQLLTNQYSSSLENNPNNIGVVQVKDTNTMEFRGSNNLGNADLKIDVISYNGLPTFSQTFPGAIQVVLNGGSGTGDIPGTTYSNIVASANGNPSTGMPFAVTVQADKGSGLTSVNMTSERIMVLPNMADVEAGRLVMDADGNVWFLVSGFTSNLVLVGKGPIQNLGSSYTDERWATGTVSNTLSLQASGNLPTNKLLFRYLRGSCAPGGRLRLSVYDPASNTDVTSAVIQAGGLTFSDNNAFSQVNGPDDTGALVNWLKVRKTGRFWIQATVNGKSTDKFYVLSTPYGDLLLKEGSTYVFDTHVSFVRPFRNETVGSNLRMMGVLVNLTRCGSGNIGTTSIFLEDVGNGTGKTMPTMQTNDDSKFTDADGQVWGLYYFKYTVDTGSEDVPDFSFLGSGPNPFDPNSSLNKWPNDTVYSRLWSGAVSSNGAFRARVFKNTKLSLVTVNARP